MNRARSTTANSSTPATKPWVVNNVQRIVPDRIAPTTYAVGAPSTLARSARYMKTEALKTTLALLESLVHTAPATHQAIVLASH